MKQNLFRRSAALISTLLFAAACTSKHAALPLMSGPRALHISTLATDKPSANPQVTAATPSINATLTLNKSSLLGREFIYGLDLQYSSQFDKTDDLYTQSQVAGHWPATFVINGGELQLIAAMGDQYPSDVNHPNQLISRYVIISQDETTITVAGAKSAPFVALQLLADPSADPKPGIEILDAWTRSLTYVASGDYLLQESSLETPDGTVFEVMESVFPRAVIAAGAEFKPFKMSPDTPNNAAPDSPAEVSRYRFLPGATVFNGEDKHAWSQHFDLSPKADGSLATIDWYVTANIPDEDMAPVKEAVEGWNRYFRTYEGFKRDVVIFKGRLPDGIHLGDPRYNVINWDNRQVAGAAYESQGSDPDTGVQSHSLIYMPAAWLKIGTDYWSQGFASQNPASSDLRAKARRGRLGRLTCARDLSDALQIAASGRLPADQAKIFGIEILKQTLFHEVGHALGLAHNFKGSLSWNPRQPGSIFSTSIMDYNDYEIERAAFGGLNSSTGPLLEYDRQALSALYDQGRSVASTDAVVPACNDTEADHQDGGVDPLCIRYDNEADPTQSVMDAVARVSSPTVAIGVSLAQALVQVPRLALPAEKVASIQNADDLNKAASGVAQQLKGSLAFYLTSGNLSLSKSLRLSLKSLYAFAPGVLPTGYDELAMRERVFSAVQTSVGMLALPQVVRDAEASAIEATLQILQSAPAFKTLGATETSHVQSTLRAAMTKIVASFDADPKLGLVRLRVAVLTALARQPAVPFYLGSISGTHLDIETAIVSLLAEIVAKNNPARASDERIAAAGALASFKGRLSGNNALAAVTSALTDERANASSNEERDTVEEVLAALGLN